MTTSTIAALFGTMLAIAIVPGPSDFAVVARSLASGFAQGVAMVAGIVAADLFFVVLAVFGLAVVDDGFGGLFRWVRDASGVLLVVLGVGVFRAGARAGSSGGGPPPGGASAGASFATGLLVTLGDPKALLFYLALLPAFLDPARATAADAAVVALVATVVICGVKLAWAAAADRARALFASRRAMRGLHGAAGSALVAAGVFVLSSG